MSEREIVMSLFVRQTLSLFFKKLLKVILLAHLFNAFNKSLFLNLFDLLLVHLLLLDDLMIILYKKHLFLDFPLLVLQADQLTVLHLLQVLTEQLPLRGLPTQLRLAIREHNPLSRPLPQLFQHESLESL